MAPPTTRLAGVRPEAEQAPPVRRRRPDHGVRATQAEWVGLLPVVLIVVALVLLAWSLAWLP